MDLVRVVAHERDPRVRLRERSGRIRGLTEDRRPDHEERVVRRELVAQPRPVGGEDARIEPVILREAGPGAEGFLEDGRHEPFGKVGDRRPGFPVVRAGPDHERRRARVGQKRYELVDRLLVGGSGPHDPLGRRILTLRIRPREPVVHRHDHDRRASVGRCLVRGPGDRTGHVLRADRLVDPDRILAGKPLEPAGEERLVRQVAAVLLADEHDERSPVDPRGCERADRVSQPGGRVQEDERGLASPDRPARREPDHGRFVEGEHEAEVLREVDEERHFGRAGVPEDRGQSPRPENVVRRVADRAETALLAHARGSIPQRRSSV